VWRILKALEDSKPHGVRELSGTNPSTTIRYLRLMTQWGLVQYRWGFRKKLYSITPLGRRLLECYDQIGEIVKTIRGRKGRGSDIEGVTTASGQGRGATPGQPLPRRT
jgi:predicted transcriptional regulator